MRTVQNGYIDLHCDTLSRAGIADDATITKINGTMIDIQRLKKSGVMAQFFAMFLPQRDDAAWFGYEKMPDLWDLMLHMRRVFQNTLEENRDCLAFAGNYEELIRNRDKGKISAFLTIENGSVVEGDFARLEQIYDMGVRLITLTWNDPNCFGWNHSKDEEQMNRGLTDFGIEAIARMNDLGILIDVSHLSDGGFYDVARYSKKPFIASHSNCRSLCPSTRNLTDDMIRLLAEKGGVSGINFEPTFLDAKCHEIGWDYAESKIEYMCDMVEHFVKIGGIECVGIGSDFDGIGGNLEIADCTQTERLFEALKKRKFSEEKIDYIIYKNVLRVIKDVL